MDPILGIDIGGSGIKGAPINLHTGELVGERLRIPTPDEGKPDDVGETVAELVRRFAWNGLIGCGFPAVVQGGVAMSAANIHESWIGTNVSSLFSELTGCPTTVINDADAAGLAEMRFGAGKDRKGTVLLLTIGTGIGSAIFTDGVLLPNTEFGHLRIRGKDAERRASDATRERKELSWEAWAERVNEFLQRVEALIWPDLIIIGGGVSKEHKHFFPHLSVKAEIVPAQFLNLAGIVGAALAAQAAAGNTSLREPAKIA